MIAIFGSHVTHNASVNNGGRSFAYKLSKCEHNQPRFKEILAAEVRVSTC